MRTILSFIILRDCHVAEKEHKKSFRQFAHTGHYPRVICVCEDMFKLPNNYIAGLIVHECGHIILFRHIFKGLFGGLYIMWLGMAIVVLGISMVIGKIIMYLEKKVEELK